MTDSLLRKLSGADRRSIGRVPEVVADVLANPELFGALFDGMLHADPIIRMRAADAVEKITARRPELLQPHKKKLIGQVARIDQQEVRWHVALMFSRLKLTPRERQTVKSVLDEYLKDESRIVRTFAMQALAEVAAQDAGLRPAIVGQLRKLTRSGSPAMKSRGRKLLAQLQQK